ncbi:MAG: hypothetical protein ACOC38_05405 [Promethearchaeia archaeon]
MFHPSLPVLALLVPIACDFASLSPVIPLTLVFAINIGGYILTPLGSPADMVAIGFSENEGDDISFKEFVKVGINPFGSGTGWLLLISCLL